MKLLRITLIMTTAFFVNNICFAQSKDETEVREVLSRQSEAWNNGNLEAFMQGYWNNDSLKFIGKEITYGWKATLANYRKGYPDTASMGKLNFELKEVKRLSVMYFFVIGKWNLTRTAGNVGGAFSLLFKKIKGKWVIVVDHTS